MKVNIPEDEATSTAVGVAKPRAHGQATTSTSIASFKLSKIPLLSKFDKASLYKTLGYQLIPAFICELFN